MFRFERADLFGRAAILKRNIVVVPSNEVVPGETDFDMNLAGQPAFFISKERVVSLFHCFLLQEALQEGFRRQSAQ